MLIPRVKGLAWPSSRPTRFEDVLFFDRLVRRLRPCCILSNFAALSIMMTVGKLRSVPARAHWYHTLSSQIEADRHGSRWMLRLRRLRARFPMSFATHIIANSNAAMEDVINRFGVPSTKCHVFWNVLDDRLEQPRRARLTPLIYRASLASFARGVLTCLRARTCCCEPSPKWRENRPK